MISPITHPPCSALCEQPRTPHGTWPLAAIQNLLCSLTPELLRAHGNAVTGMQRVQHCLLGLTILPRWMITFLGCSGYLSVGESGEPSEGRNPAGNMENLLGSCLSGQKVSEKADGMAPARLWGCQEAVSQEHTMVHLHIPRARRDLAAAPTFHRGALERPWRCCSNYANRAYRSRGLGVAGENMEGPDGASSALGFHSPGCCPTACKPDAPKSFH